MSVYSSDVMYKTIVDQAYTEDNIIIKNVFMNLSKNDTLEETLKYFKEFGEVSSYQWLEENENKQCFINFCDSKVAAKVLQKYGYVSRHNPFHVRACESWQQPDGERIIKVLTELAETHYSYFTTNPAHKALILTLNDDCLECICKKLDTVDQINFALACQRFSGIFNLLSSVKHRHLNTEFFISNSLTKFQINIFLLIVGPQVKMLSGSLNSNENFKSEMLRSYCTNVECLKINMDTKALIALTEKMKFLKELWLSDNNLTDVTIKCVESLTNLRKLHIMPNSILTGKYIYNFCDLVRLSLYECSNIEPSHFKEICKNLTNLSYLDITGCVLLKTDDFEHILQHLLQLKILKLSTTGENFNCIAQLPKLKQLTLTENVIASITEDFLQHLAKHQAHQLQELLLENAANMTVAKASLVSDLKNLKFFSCCKSTTFNDECLAQLTKLPELEAVNFSDNNNVSHMACLELLKCCLKLKKLNLINCQQLEIRDFLPKALEILQEQRSSGLRTDCVHIMLTTGRQFQTNVDRMLTDIFLSRYAKYSDVLKVSVKNCRAYTREMRNGFDADFLYNVFVDEYEDYEEYDNNFNEFDVDDDYLEHDLNDVDEQDYLEHDIYDVDHQDCLEHDIYDVDEQDYLEHDIYDVDHQDCLEHDIYDVDEEDYLAYDFNEVDEQDFLEHDFDYDVD